jgi:transcriptional regulator with XRE-family HTH domain
MTFLHQTHDSQSSQEASMDIRQARRQAGISQVQLARMIGVDQSAVSRIERGQRSVTVDRLVAISKVLGVEPSLLLHSNRAS